MPVNAAIVDSPNLARPGARWSSPSSTSTATAKRSRACSPMSQSRFSRSEAGRKLTINRAVYGAAPDERIGWFVATCLALYIAMYSVGPGVVVWLALSELMPTRIRSNDVGIAMLVNQGVSTGSAAVFLPVVAHCPPRQQIHIQARRLYSPGPSPWWSSNNGGAVIRQAANKPARPVAVPFLYAGRPVRSGRESRWLARCDLRAGFTSTCLNG